MLAMTSDLSPLNPWNSEFWRFPVRNFLPPGNSCVSSKKTLQYMIDTLNSGYVSKKLPFFQSIFIHFLPYIWDRPWALRPALPPPPNGMGPKPTFLATFHGTAKAHGIYNALTSTASETVVFAAFCNTTIVYYYSYSITTMYKPT